MLEKNKDYLEMRVSSTDCAFTQNEAAQISIDGCVYTTYMDIPDPGKLYVFISKEKFEKLQARADSKAELAKDWEMNYDLLLKRTGFDTVEELVNYLDSEAECDTLREAMSSLAYSVKFARDERRSLSKKLDECEKDYISESDKAEALEKENEQLKQKLHEFDPMPDYKELLKELYSTEDVEKPEWTLNHICGGRGSANGWMATARFWRQNYETLSKLVGFSSVEEIQDYLTNEAEADTLYEAISKLHDQVKYTCDEWYSANSRNNSWKAAAECNSPKELMEKIEGFETEIIDLKTKKTEYACKIQDLIDDSCGRKTVIEAYKRDIERWKEATGCPTPIAAKTWIESGMSYEHGYHEVQEENRKLTDEVKSWQNVTGHATPEDYLAAKIHTVYVKLEPSNVTWRDATGCDTPEEAKTLIESISATLRESNRVMLKELENNFDEWQKATGCDTPDDVTIRIQALNERINESEACYNYLLMLTGFGDEGEIEDALDKCDHSTLRKALVDYEFNYEALLKSTGYKSEHDIRVMLNNSEQFVYKDMRELINSLKRKLKFTDSNWQDATGRISPEAAKQYIDRLKGRLNKIHGYSVDW